MKVSISDIHVSERLREIDDAKVADLVESISNIGLLSPVIVDTENNLLAGNHRLHAYKELGFDEIECVCVNLQEQQKKLVEIDENLVRNDLNVIEKSEHIILKESILDQLGLRATQKNNQYAGEGFYTSKILASEIDVSERKYLWMKQIHRINSTARMILKGTQVSNNIDSLLMIERLRDDALQIEIATRIKNGYSGKIRRLIKDLQNEIKQNEVLASIDGYENSNDEKVKLYHGDFRIESEKIDDNSIDLIFTDGPYLDSIELYRDMAIVANRVLKDGSSLLCYLTQSELPEVLSVMSEFLNYYWIIALKHGGNSGSIRRTGRHGRGIFVEWKPILWFVKGKRKRNEFVADLVESSHSEKVFHEWEQSEIEADYYISYLTEIGDSVLDLMMGSGTTGISAIKCKRKFIGIEQEKRTFGIAKGRILNDIQKFEQRPRTK